MMWSDLEHRVHKFLKQKAAEGSQYFVALSGGVDSVALLFLLKRIRLPVRALHCHHGNGVNQDFRDRSVVFCKNLCEQFGIPIFIFKSEKALSSEEEMREFRYGKMLDFVKTQEGGVLLTAHHLEDQLETRLLRLLRGTGHQGLVGVQEQRGELLRPLVGMSKQELISYIQSHKLEFLEDPSNLQNDYARNWVRNELLPFLEAKMPGVSGSLARSLETLVEEWKTVSEKSLMEQNSEWDTEGISRGFYLSLSREEQKSLLAQYLLSLGKSDFSQGQVIEITKLLDKVQNEHTFTVAGLVWQVNAGQIKVVK